MKNITIAVLAVLLLCPTAYAADEDSYFTDELLNGYGWRIFDNSEKTNYIMGFVEGIHFCSTNVELNFAEAETDQESVDRALEALGHFIVDAKYKEVRKYIDEFYSNPFNRDIPITSAYSVFVGERLGFFDEVEKNEMIEALKVRYGREEDDQEEKD